MKIIRCIYFLISLLPFSIKAQNTDQLNLIYKTFSINKTFLYEEKLNGFNENGEYIDSLIYKTFSMKVLNRIIKKDTVIVFLNRFFNSEIFNKNNDSPVILIFTTDACYKNVSFNSQLTEHSKDAELLEINIANIISKNFTLLMHFPCSDALQPKSYEDSIGYSFLIKIDPSYKLVLKNKNSKKTTAYTYQAETMHSIIKYIFSSEYGFLKYDFDFGDGVAKNGNFILKEIK